MPTEHWYVFRWFGDGLSVGAIVGAFLGLLPAVAAIAAFIWYLIQIYESDTAQKWLDKRRAFRKSARITKLRAEQKVLLAELEALELVREARAVAGDKVAKATHEANVLKQNQDTHTRQADLAPTLPGGAFKSVPAIDDG